MRSLLFVVGAALLILSGCFGGEDRGDGQSGEQADASSADRDSMSPTDNRSDKGRASGPESINWNMTGTIPLDGVYLGMYALGGDDPHLVVDLPGGAAGLVAEFSFTGDRNDFDLFVRSPNYCGRSQDTAESLMCTVGEARGQSVEGGWVVDRGPGQVGPGYLRLQLEADDLADNTCEEQSCEWGFRGMPILVVDAEFLFHVTVFLENPPPDDFRMIPEP